MEEGWTLTKKVISYQLSPASDIQQAYYTKLRAIEARMESEGVDLAVHPTMSVETLAWCRGISLCIPMDVRNQKDIVALATLARRLIKGETTLTAEFPGYQYGREDWLSETELRNQDRQSQATGTTDGFVELLANRTNKVAGIEEIDAATAQDWAAKE